jgi:peptidyl-prolyl cis-trans isomerase NIMA-interacting 1
VCSCYSEAAAAPATGAVGGPPAEASQPAGSRLTAGQQCLEDAAAPRLPPTDAPARITVAHILVRHAGLDDPRGASRSRETACLRALDALQALKDGGDWAEVARQYSDSKDDALGRVSRDDLTRAFANAAFSLEVNQLSYVVESDRGFHIILRQD